MLRTILIIIVVYLVIRIALRLLLTESPSQRRNRVRSGFGSANHTGGHWSVRNNRKSARRRIEDIEEAEFEEIPGDAKDKDKP